MDYYKLSHRRTYIGNIIFFAFFNNDDYTYEQGVCKLPFHVLKYLYRIAIHRYSTESLFLLNRNHLVVNGITDEYIRMIKSIVTTSRIKEELLSKTIPNYKPPTIRQRMSEQLGFDVSHISIRGLQLLEKQYDIYGRMIPLDDGLAYMDFSDNNIFFWFDVIACSMNRTCLIKEELIAKVFHPDRFDKWVNL